MSSSTTRAATRSRGTSTPTRSPTTPPPLSSTATRIDAFAFCLYTALLVHALVERQLRAGMAAAGIDQLSLYHEDRPCKTPTAVRVLEILEPLARTHVTHDGCTLAVVDPDLTPLQRQLLDLLDVPLDAYQTR